MNLGRRILRLEVMQLGIHGISRSGGFHCFGSFLGWYGNVGSHLDINSRFVALPIIVIHIVYFMVILIRPPLCVPVGPFATLLFHVFWVTQALMAIFGTGRTKWSFAGASRLSFAACQASAS